MTDKTLAKTTAARLLSDLIKCASVTPEEAGALEVLERFLTPLGFSCTRLRFEGESSYPVDNLFATRHRSGRHLLFAGHTDVVPPGAESDWTHPPFAAEIADGRIYGRGACDMKSGIAAFSAAVAAAVADGSADAGTISLAITNDEEADAVNGTRRLMEWADAEGFKFDFAIVGEPVSGETVGDRLKTGRRGSFDGRITVTGKQGHAAYPERARNPVPVIAALALALKAVPLDEGNDRFQPSNLEITSIDVGNTATNVIPARAAMRFNVRHNDIWSPETLSAWIGERIATVNAQGCAIAFDNPSPPAHVFVCPPGEGVAALDAVIAGMTGAAPEHSTSGGTSDARFIARYCPVVECGLVGDSMHQVDENVPLGDLEALTRLYGRFITRFFAS